MFEILLASALLGVFASPDQDEEKMIREEVVLDAPLEAVWQAWTTSEGLETFFGRHCLIEPRPEGALEIWFDPEAPVGHRGAEGLKVLAVEPRSMLAFTWSAPPKYPDVRRQRTSVVVRFSEAGSGRTRVRLIHSGWGEGPQWVGTFEYFEQAWNVIMTRLEYRFKHGPVDWENPPALHRSGS